MKLQSIVVGALALLGVVSAHAGEYSCKVYCSGGSTYVTVPASSSSDAAKKIDPTPVANQICQNANLGNASSSTMSSNQCSSK